MLALEQLYESQTVDVLRPIMRSWTARFRGRDQALLDVVPDRARTDFGLVTQLEQVDRFGFWEYEHRDNMTVILSTVNIPWIQA